MKQYLKYISVAVLMVILSQPAKSQNVNIILDFTHKKVSSDGLSWTFDLEAKGDVGYGGPNNNNWRAFNIRLDLNLPAGVSILNGSGITNPNFASELSGVQTVVFGDSPPGQKELGLTLSRGDQTDLNMSTFVKLATFTVNFTAPVNQSDLATARPSANASGSSWTNAADDPGSGNQLGVRRPFLMPLISALPVTLKSFNATKEGTTVELNWATTEETNSDRFDIQRSADGKEWSTIQTVIAKGESKVEVAYSAVDSDPFEGENLYRLHMVDKDGTSANSRIVNVKFEGLATYLYPNPVSEELTIKAANWSNIAGVRIVNKNGREVYKSSGKPSQIVNVKNMPGGIYLVHLTTTNGSGSTYKIVVNK